MNNPQLEAKAMECFMKNSMPYKIEEDTDSGITYIGYASGFPADSDSEFAIMRMVETLVGNTTTTVITFPDGSLNFKYVWDDRASLSYASFSNI